MVDQGGVQLTLIKKIVFHSIKRKKSRTSFSQNRNCQTTGSKGKNYIDLHERRGRDPGMPTPGPKTEKTAGGVKSQGQVLHRFSANRHSRIIHSPMTV